MKAAGEIAKEQHRRNKRGYAIIHVMISGKADRSRTGLWKAPVCTEGATPLPPVWPTDRAGSMEESLRLITERRALVLSALFLFLHCVKLASKIAQEIFAQGKVRLMSAMCAYTNIRKRARRSLQRSIV